MNNGGVCQRSLIRETEIVVDKRLMDINYFGTVSVTKAILPHFIKNGIELDKFASLMINALNVRKKRFILPVLKKSWVYM